MTELKEKGQGDWAVGMVYTHISCHPDPFLKLWYSAGLLCSLCRSPEKKAGSSISGHGGHCFAPMTMHTDPERAVRTAGVTEKEGLGHCHLPVQTKQANHFKIECYRNLNSTPPPPKSGQWGMGNISTTGMEAVERCPKKVKVTMSWLNERKGPQENFLIPWMSVLVPVQFSD